MSKHQVVVAYDFTRQADVALERGVQLACGDPLYVLHFVTVIDSHQTYQTADRIRHPRLPEMPHLDRQPAPQMPQQPHQHIDRWQILHPTPADHHPAPRKAHCRIRKLHLGHRVQHRAVPEQFRLAAGGMANLHRRPQRTRDFAGAQLPMGLRRFGAFFAQKRCLSFHHFNRGEREITISESAKGVSAVFRFSLSRCRLNRSVTFFTSFAASYPGIEMVNVYGVAVPGADGRAGMVALTLSGSDEFDPRAFYAHAVTALPAYATPVFVRLQREAEVTGTFKLRKVELQEEGYDPAKITEPLFVRDDAGRSYVPLDNEAHRRLLAGELRV